MSAAEPPRAGHSMQSSLVQPAPFFLQPPYLFLLASGFGEGRITRSQTPVIWQKITQMGQTEPAEPTGSWE